VDARFGPGLALKRKPSSHILVVRPSRRSVHARTRPAPSVIFDAVMFVVAGRSSRSSPQMWRGDDGLCERRVGSLGSILALLPGGRRPEGRRPYADLKSRAGPGRRMDWGQT